MKRVLRFPTPTRILEDGVPPAKSALPTLKPKTFKTRLSLGQDVIKRRALGTIVSLYLGNLKRVYALQEKHRGEEREKKRAGKVIVLSVIGITALQWSLHKHPLPGWFINSTFQADPNCPGNANQ